MNDQFTLADPAVLDQIFALIDQRICWMDEVGIRQEKSLNGKENTPCSVK